MCIQNMIEIQQALHSLRTASLRKLPKTFRNYFLISNSFLIMKSYRDNGKSSFTYVQLKKSFLLFDVMVFWLVQSESAVRFSRSAPENLENTGKSDMVIKALNN